MKSNFEACIDIVLGYEGGYSNNPADPGGETRWGISKRAYPNLNIKTLTIDQAEAIYRRDYWDAVHGDDLPLGVDLVTLDYAVNSGPVTAIKALQTCASVVPDGVIGPLTLAAVAKNRNATILMLCAKRLAYLESLSTWAAFGKGWSARVASVRQHALNMASAPASAPIEPPPVIPKPAPTPTPILPIAPNLGLWQRILNFFNRT